MKRSKLILGILGVTFALSAEAYIPPSWYLASQIAKKHSPAAPVTAQFQWTLYESNAPTSTKLREVLHWESAQSLLESIWLDESGSSLLAQMRRSLNSSAAVGANADAEKTNPANFLVFSSDVDALAASLMALEVPIKTESELLKLKDESERRLAEQTRLVRMGEKLAWVIGNNANGAELWIEKDSFFPIRLRWKAKGIDREVRFQKFRSAGEFWIPQEISYLENDIPQAVGELQRVVTGVRPKDMVIRDSGNRSSPSGAQRRLLDLIFQYLR